MFKTDLQRESQLPSSKRPIPLVARPDLVIERIGYQKNEHWVVKIPTSLKYHRLRPEQYFLLKSLDGQSSLETLRARFRAEFPAVVPQLTDIQRLAIDLYEKGLVYSDRLGQGESLLEHRRKERGKKFLGALQNLLYIRLPGWDPYYTLERLYKYCWWMFHPAAVMMAVAAVVAAWVLVLVQFSEFQNRLPAFREFFGWPNMMFLWLTLAGAKILHEFGHALTCKHFGGECHEIGVMLLVFSPTLYCDVSDSWMLRNKWQRIAIGAAGMYVEVVLSAVAIFIWWHSQPGLLNHLCLNLFFITTISTVIFNANPLMRYDGYFMLADFLEIPNLRPKADKLLREQFAWHCLGIEPQPDPFMPETGKAWFVAFAVAAWLYRWLIVFGILTFLYSFLKPYDLQSIGVTLAVASLIAMIFNPVRQLYQIISAPRAEPMNKVRTTATVVTLAFIVGGLLAVPIPLHYTAPFVIEPYDVKDVYTTVAGELTDFDVKFGQTVERGQVLAKLSNLELQEKHAELKSEARVQEAEVAMQHARENWSAYELATKKLKMLQQELAEHEQQLSRLTITAPCAGVLVAPARRTKKASQTNVSDLGSWHGTPLEDRNRNAFLPESTAIAGVAPNADFQAILLVDQADRRDLYIGQPVDFKLEHLPDRTFSGVVSEISEREREFVPHILSNKHGGTLPTVTDAQGREKLSGGVAYQAKVRLNEDTTLLASGMRGRARFLVSSRTAGDWIWQSFRRTFHFRL